MNLTFPKQPRWARFYRFLNGNADLNLSLSDTNFPISLPFIKIQVGDLYSL